MLLLTRSWFLTLSSSTYIAMDTLALQLRHHHVHTRGQGQEPAACQEQYNFLSNLVPLMLQGRDKALFSLSKISRSYVYDVWFIEYDMYNPS